MKFKIVPLLISLAVCALLLGCSGSKNNTKELKSEADLSGLVISTTAGNYYDNKYSAREDVTVFRVNTEADGIQALRQGIADVHVTDEIAFSSQTRSQLNIKLAFCGEESFNVAFAIRKGNLSLADELNRFITESKADGTIDAIIDHWLEGSPLPTLPQPQASGREPIKCITGVNMEPVCFIGDDGEWMGIDADILKRFAIWSGRPFQMTFQSLSSGIIALNTGQCDVVSACLYATDERKKSVDFTIPYTDCRAGFFVISGNTKGSLSFGEKLKNNLITDHRWKLITDGLLETLKITFFSILLGTLLGAGVCAMLRSRRKWVRRLISLYGSFIQGMPTLVMLLIMFYVVLAGSGLGGTLIAIFTFSLFFAWSSGSIFNTSISTVPKGQTEAGLSLGFTPLRTFTGIVFPQALKKGLPMYIGDCISLLKSTSIVGYIAIQDLTRASDLIRSRTFDAIIPLLIVTVLYFVIAWLIRLLLNLFLKKK